MSAEGTALPVHATILDDRGATIAAMVAEPAARMRYADYLAHEREAPTKHEEFAHYRRLASLREYVLVAQKARRVEVYRREGDRWVLTEHGPGTVLELPSIAARLAVDEIYRDPLPG